jgi:FemAB-related protein (PEP-CTERM system-associated)
MPEFTVGPFRGSPAEWDGFVRATPGWTHFHLFGWKAVIEDVFGHECRYSAARDSAGRLAGILPLVRVKSLLFGHFLVSMPFVNYGGPLGDASAVQALVKMATAEADAAGVKLLELRSRYPLDLTLPVSHRKVTVVLDLPAGGSEALWRSFSPKLRSQVRRPQKEGVACRFGPDEVGPFYAVFARHMRDLGTPVLSLRLFEAIARAFPDDVWFGCAYLGQEPIAAGAGFRWGNEFEMTWASALRAYSRIAPNMLLYWTFLQRCAELDVGAFNFGRCTPGGGTHRFKRQWGAARDEQLWWYQHASTGVTGTPSPDSGGYALGPKLWRWVPLWVAARLGPRIVRGIP